MILSCIQPCFVPWLGYFEQIARADVFVYLDDVRYTKRDWRNNNRLKSPYFIKNIYVPVRKPNREMLINQVLISYNERWEKKIINKLNEWYRKAPFFDEILPIIESGIFNKYERLVDLNYYLNNQILQYLEINTPVFLSSEIEKRSSDKNERIIEICKHFEKIDLLYDGKSARNFIDQRLFNENGISLVFQDYYNFPYPQLWDRKFAPSLSILDVLMNCGPESKQIILSSPVPFEMAVKGKDVFYPLPENLSIKIVNS